MFTMEYPQSRIRSSGQCHHCRVNTGWFENKGVVKMQGEGDGEVSLLRWTCNYCGYTMLFDYSVARSRPFTGAETEVFPDNLK